MSFPVVNAREIATAVVVAPNDSVNIGSNNVAKFWNRLFVGVSNDVALVLEDNSVITFKTMTAGIWHHMPPFKRINSTNTTATNMVAGVTFSN